MIISRQRADVKVSFYEQTLEICVVNEKNPSAKCAGLLRTVYKNSHLDTVHCRRKRNNQERVKSFLVFFFIDICTFDKSFFNLYNESTKFKGGLFMSNQNKIQYRQVGDYLIPNLALPSEEASVRLGKWGMLHKDYLFNHKKVLFTTLLTQGNLYQYCSEVEKQAQDMFDTLVEQMKEAEGVTEKLKTENQIEWICRMQNIEIRAREIIIVELIYT